jgi:hypothetical protein
MAVSNIQIDVIFSKEQRSTGGIRTEGRSAVERSTELTPKSATKF